MSNAVGSFFGSGYTEKKPEYNISINVMGKIYNALEKIEFHEGDIFIDGNRKDKLPITSGTWYKILKGKSFREKNKLIIN